MAIDCQVIFMRPGMIYMRPEECLVPLLLLSYGCLPRLLLLGQRGIGGILPSGCCAVGHVKGTGIAGKRCLGGIPPSGCCANGHATHVTGTGNGAELKRKFLQALNSVT